MPHRPSLHPSRRALGLWSAALLGGVVAGSTVVAVTRRDAPMVIDRAVELPAVKSPAASVRVRPDGHADRPADVGLAPSTGGLRRHATTGHSSPEPVADSSQARAHLANTPPEDTTSLPRPPRTRGGSLTTVLPPSVIEVAATTVWDDRATESLDRLLLIAFDADGDLELDDLERIAAVQMMRDVMWPTAAEDGKALLRDVLDRPRSGTASESTLGPEDLRLHHDVDESRRLDHAAKRERGEVPATTDEARDRTELHAEIVETFQLVDDDRLSATEFTRFLLLFRAGSQQADLSRDGRTDEADMRLFLDVARPIRDE